MLDNYSKLGIQLTSDYIADEGKIRARIGDNSSGQIEKAAPRIRSLLCITINDFQLPLDGFWQDAFESRGSFIFCPATRIDWQWAFSIARAALKYNSVYIPAFECWFNMGGQTLCWDSGLNSELNFKYRRLSYEPLEIFHSGNLPRVYMKTNGDKNAWSSF